MVGLRWVLQSWVRSHQARLQAAVPSTVGKPRVLGKGSLLSGEHRRQTPPERSSPNLGSIISCLESREKHNMNVWELRDTQGVPGLGVQRNHIVAWIWRGAICIDFQSGLQTGHKNLWTALGAWGNWAEVPEQPWLKSPSSFSRYLGECLSSICPPPFFNWRTGVKLKFLKSWMKLHLVAWHKMKIHRKSWKKSPK